MNDLSFLDSVKDKKILVAPLDWGLGHATRSSRIIDKLRESNEVQLASSGLALTWLQKRYPKLSFHQLPSYNIQYRSNAMWLNMVQSLPQLIQSIKEEQRVVDQLVKEHQFDLIISDHRFGTASPECRNVVIAHQIYIPHDNPIIASIASFLNRRFLNRYDELWIPDYADPLKSLSGKLSRSNKIKSFRFIGPLSMMESESRQAQQDIDITILLSGPEPSRSNLEMQLANILKDHSEKNLVLIRGSNQPLPKQILESKTFESIINLAFHKEIESVLLRSKTIICRSGYSTIMDLEALGRKAILIPTMNQPEQEYLAEYHSKRGFKSLYESDLIDKKSFLRLLS